MSKELQDGVWVIVCDWKHPDTGGKCNLGVEEQPAMFIDPDGGRNPDYHFQCGRHHGIIKQEEKAEFKLPDGHKLDETTIQPQGKYTADKIGVTLEGFKPDAAGRVWDGGKVSVQRK